MKKYCYLLFIIILSFCGYLIYQKHIQNKNWQYFFGDSERTIFTSSSRNNSILNYQFLQKLSAPFSPSEITKYNPCLISNDIFTLNAKNKVFPQDKLKETFKTECQKVALIYNNKTYYRYGFWLCNTKENCEYILLQLDNFLILKNERIVQIQDHRLIELDYLSFFKNTLKIDNPKDVVFVAFNNTGLGNNLFQYYGALVYAKKWHKKLVVLKKRPIHDIFSNITKPTNALNTFQLKDFSFHVYNRKIDFDTEHLLLNQNPINANNFIGFEDFIRNQTTFKYPLSHKNKQIARHMQNENSVAVHIRRGDFKTTGIDMLKMSYYDKAIQYMKSHLSNPHFYIFSDDIKWCKENFKLSTPHTFVDWNTKDYEDLHLMTQSKHNIIANSSFSWWGAFLNKNPNKIVIVPKNGFYSNENTFYNEDIISFTGCVPIDN